MEFRINAEKDHLCYYKNSTNQTFTLIRSKTVYFNKYLTTIATLGNDTFIRSKVVSLTSISEVQHPEETKFL